MKSIIFHICLGMRGKNIWMSQFLYPKQWGRRELFSRRRRIRGLVPAAQEALVFGGGSAGHCGARTGLRWVHRGEDGPSVGASRPSLVLAPLPEVVLSSTGLCPWSERC